MSKYIANNRRKYLLQYYLIFVYIKYTEVDKNHIQYMVEVATTKNF